MSMMISITLITLILLSLSMIFLPSEAAVFMALINILTITLNTSAIYQTIYLNGFFSLDQVSFILMFLTILVFMFMPMMNNFLMFNFVKFKNKMVFTLQLILLLVFLTTSPLVFYVLFELSLLPIFLIIMGWGYQIERLSAATAMIMYTISASLPLLAFILMMLTNVMVANFSSMNIALMFNNKILTVFTIMAVTGFLVKFPIFLGHLWLPKAHVEAPASGSMILAAILLKLGGYGVIRFSELTLNTSISLLSALALWGGFISALICVQNLDLKIIVAYSSVAHMSMVIASLFTLSKTGLVGGLILMVAHGLSSSGLFLGVGVMSKYSNSRSLILNKSILTFSPYMTMAWFLIVVVGMGIPPSLNFMGELSCVMSFINDNFLNLVISALMIFLAGCYSLILFSCPNQGGVMLLINKKISYLVSEKLLILLHSFWAFFLVIFLPLMD